MKKIIFSLVSIFVSLQAFATNSSTVEAQGWLRSGNGPCIITVTKQFPEEANNPFYRVSFTTNNYQFIFSNEVLDNGYLDKAFSLFEKVGNHYSMVTAPIFPYPRLYDVRLTNLGNNEFEIKRTTLIFSVETFSSSDVCMIRNSN